MAAKKKKPQSSTDYLAGLKEWSLPTKTPPKTPATPAISPTYNLKFDPMGWQSTDKSVLSEEAKSIRDLYYKKTGQNLEDAVDAQEALKASGVIGAARFAGQNVSSIRSTQNLFASAVDAYDAMISAGDKKIGKYKLPLSSAISNPLLDRVGSAPIGSIKGEPQQVRDIPMGLLKETGKTTARVIAGIGRGVEAIGDAPITSTKLLNPITRKPLGIGTDSKQTIQDVSKPIATGLGRIPAVAVTPLALLATGGKPKSITETKTELEKKAFKPNLIIDLSVKGQVVPKEISDSMGWSEAQNGSAGVAIDQNLRANNIKAISRGGLAWLAESAEKNGWNPEEFNNLLLGERFYRAANRYSPVWKTIQSLSAGIAGMSAVPAGIIGIYQTTKNSVSSGDWSESEKLIEAAIAPYKTFIDYREKNGTSSAIEWFATTYPLDFVYAVAGAFKVVGIAGGVGARGAGTLPAIGRSLGVVTKGPPGRVASTLERFGEYARPYQPIVFKGDEVKGAGDRVPIPRPVEPVNGSGVEFVQYARDVAAWNKKQRDAAAQEDIIGAAPTSPWRNTPYEVVAPRVTRVESTVGYTSNNLLSTIIDKEVKSRIASRSKWYNDHKTMVFAKKYTRRQLQIVDNAGKEIEAAIGGRLGRTPTAEELNRVAFELSMSTERGKLSRSGNPIMLRPKDYAAFYDRQARDLNMYEDGSAAKKIRFEASRDAYLELGKTVIDPSILIEIKKIARKVSDQNEELMARILGKSVSETKQTNYIRQLIMDPTLEEFVSTTAKATMRTANKRLDRLVLVQKRVASLSAKLESSSSGSGWGKLSGPKSVKRFAEVERQLVLELRRGVVLATRAGDGEMAARFTTALDRVASGRVESVVARGERADIARRSEYLALTDRQVATLTTEQRAAYDAAVAADANLIGLESTRSVVLETAGVKTVTKATLAHAEARVRKAADELARRQAFPIPDRASVAAAKKILSNERAGLKLRRSVMSKQKPIVESKKDRVEAVAAARKLILSKSPVIETPTLRAVIDNSETFAVIGIKKKKEFDSYYVMERARGEAFDEFIARVEQNRNDILLHIRARGEFVTPIISRPKVRADKKIQGIAGPESGVVDVRTIKSDGALFAMGGEDATKLWENLMFDTKELSTAPGWQNKMYQLMSITSMRVGVTEDMIKAATRSIEGRTFDTVEEKLAAISKSISDDLSYNKLTAEADRMILVNAIDPKALTNHRIMLGSVDRSGETVGDLFRQQIDISTLSPGPYFLMPKGVYDGIQHAIRDNAFRFDLGTRIGRTLSKVDRAMSIWRMMVLNVLPRTGFNNFVGSVILAIQGGARPQDFYYAWKAIRDANRVASGKLEHAKLSLPRELQQRFFEVQTKKVGYGDNPFKWVAYYMNSLRKFNGYSEDFARLAVYYSRAVPEAIRNSSDSLVLFSSMRRLNDDALDLLDEITIGGGVWEAKHEAFLQRSYDFLGDLHKGSAGWSTIRLAIPFAQWYAHILKLTLFTMPVHYPGRSLFIQRLAVMGQEYQAQNGIASPWGAPLMPWFAELMDTNPGAFVDAQWVVHASNSSPWYPEGTLSSAFDLSGNMKGLAFFEESLGPYISQPLLMGLSLQSMLNGGPAFRFDQNGFLKAARDEYGNDITRDNQFWQYFWNKVFKMFPLSPTIMSLAARSDSGLPLPGMTGEMTDGQMRLDPGRADLASLFANDGKTGMSQIANILFKAITGFTVGEQTLGPGVITDQRLRQQYARVGRDQKEQDNDRENTFAENMSKIHSSSKWTPIVSGENPE